MIALRKWTDEQLSAIEERSKTLLVSAAAGSGKTATLTERIIRSLTDEERPINIESLLVVTFTNAAAGELRAKLKAALEAAAAADPQNKRLEHQLYMLPSAKIRTIDSFCNDVLRAGADRVGVSSGYRIADAAECEILARSILDGLIAAVYNGDLPEIATPEAFEELADCLTDSKKTEELSEVFRFVYERCDSSEYSVDMLLPLIEYYNTEGFSGVEKTHHGSYLMKICREALDDYISAFEKYGDILSAGGGASEKYSALAKSDAAYLQALREKETYLGLRPLMLGLSFARKPAVKKDDRTPDMEAYSVMRDRMKADINKLAEYFLYTEEEWKALFDSLHSRLSVLYRFLKRFDKIFLDEKKRRSALSYGDIERLCYECLVKDGELTDIAMNLSSQFDAIYIDEYQDVNSLQNSIFKAISRENNRFMVGDIKQSIYGFRSARPEIFAEMKASFPPLSKSTGDTASVFMSRNFRCDEGIVDFVNGIFDKTFSLIGESIGYEAGDRLVYSKLHDGGEPEYRYPEICMLDKKPRGEDAEEYDTSPDVVAKKISELLSSGKLDSGRAIRPSDIAIIMRNARGKDKKYAEALEKEGIPSRISGSKSFFLSAEVLLALCLLNSIDNPDRDIYLAGLMCSPLFSFTADDLYLIRHASPKGTLYDSLVAYCEVNPDFERGSYFLSRLDYYRTIAEGIGVDTLISKLYRETGLMALAAKNGGADNLSLLYDYARGYESGAYKGLYNFISFINNIIDMKTSFDDNRDGADADAVKIVTCHASKGLEYPVVFLVDAGAPFSSGDVRSRLVLSEDFGISFRLRTPSGLAVVNSPVHDLVCHYIKRKNYEEELRVLYVALTRAREILYTVGTSPREDRESYEHEISVLRENLSPHTVRSLGSYLEIMLVTANISRPLTPAEFVSGLAESEAFEDETSENCDTHLSLPDTPPSFSDEDSEEYLRRFTYEYPNKYLSALPEKLSVSRVYPGVLDEGDTAKELFFDDEADDGDEKNHLPAFVSGGGAEESAKRGIATHYFLQFCDLENLAMRGAESELSRLLSEGYLSERDAKRVRLREIEAFARSELFADMRGARKLYRELRFNVLLPADIFTENEEQKQAYLGKEVLVQGVIDCIVEYPDGSLGLYDYKTDRLTAEERENTDLGKARLREKHSLQLSYYAMAIEKMFGKAPVRRAVYSLALGECVEV